MSDYQLYRKFAEQLVKLGGEIALADFEQQKFATEWKSDHSYVTQTDLAIETKFRSLIKAKFPNHAIYGEEFGGSLDTHTPTWILDPLDGTTNFSHHVPLFCSMAALQIEGKIVAAAIASPIQGLIFSASLGAGATINNDPFPPPSTETNLEKVTLLAESGKSAEARADSYRFLSQSGNQFRSFRKFGCMIVPLLYAAHGRLEASIIFGTDVYDIAGLSLLLQEAGYAVLGVGGATWYLSENSDFIVTAPTLKTQIENMLNKYQAEFKL